MPSETDPLLPDNEPAPEIVGHGFSRKSTKSYQDQFSSYTAETVTKDEDRGSAMNDAAGVSPMRTVLLGFVCVVAFALAISSLFTGKLGGQKQAPKVGPSEPPATFETRVEKILAENPLIDGHNDLAILIRYLYGNNIYNATFTEPFEQGGMRLHVDLPRLKKGQVGGAFWSAYVPCPTNGSDFSNANYAGTVASTLSQLDLLHRLTAKYAEVFSTGPFNSSNAADKFKEQHLLISPFSIEGLHQIGNSLANLRLYYSLNVQAATLTHNCHNAFADAALVVDSEGQTIAAPPLWGGVSEHGQILIKEMNRLGMLIDLSHVSKDTMLDVLGGRAGKWSGSTAPIMFSHSSAYKLCPHPRNVDDDVLELVKKTRSIVMVNFSPDFISCIPSDSPTGIPEHYSPNSTLHQVARHIFYIGDTIGFDHVGLGSDFDGINETPSGLEDVSKFPDLIAELLRMGMSDDDAAKVVGRNILRVSTDVSKVAADMQSQGVLPAEDIINTLDPVAESA